MRLLLVAYYFPPSGGAGVQRVLKWTKYLRDFGVEPVVLTVEAGAYPKLDPTLTADVPPGVAVHRTSALDPYGVYGRLTGRSRQEAVAEVTGHVAAAASPKERLVHWIRANVFVPDARIGWVPFAVRRGRQVIEDERIDAVLTSGPPHSVHLTGWLLQRLSGRPWIADFRDPWTDISYYDELPRTDTARALDKAFERGVLRRADRVITVSPAWRQLLLSKVQRDPSAFHVIHNGFDPADFEGDRESSGDHGEEFTLTYAGSLYGSRNPSALWEALARLRKIGEVPRLRLRLVGRLGEDVKAALRHHGLDDIVDEIPYLPHAEAVREMQRATALLLVIEAYRHERGNLTGKVYEYLAAGRPILALGPAEGDAADLLRQTEGGHIFDRKDVDGVAAFVRELYTAWEAGAQPSGASAEAAAPYSRRAETGELAAIVADLLGRTPTG